MGILGMIQSVASYCDDLDVDFRLLPVARIYHHGEPTLGLFAPSDRALMVACAYDKWYEVLAHEFGHCQQAAENLYGMAFPPQDDELGDEPDKDPTASDRFDSWLYQGLDLSPEEVRIGCIETIACEQDADRRGLDLLTQHGLVQAEDYILQANSYAYRYAYAAQTRKWVVSNVSPKSQGWQRLKTVLPTAFLRPEDYLNIPPAIQEALERLHAD